MSELKFEPVPCAPATQAPLYKIAAQKNGALKLIMNTAAYAQLDLPAVIQVQAAVAASGECFLRLAPGFAGYDWPVKVMKRGKASGVACVWIKAHPFKIDVVHAAIEVEAQASDAFVQLKMPDWEHMLAELGRDMVLTKFKRDTGEFDDV